MFVILGALFVFQALVNASCCCGGGSCSVGKNSNEHDVTEGRDRNLQE